MDINEMKARAYDTLVRIELLQNELRQLNQMIAQETQKQEVKQNEQK